MKCIHALAAATAIASCVARAFNGTLLHNSADGRWNGHPAATSVRGRPSVCTVIDRRGRFCRGSTKPTSVHEDLALLRAMDRARSRCSTAAFAARSVVLDLHLNAASPSLCTRRLKSTPGISPSRWALTSLTFSSQCSRRSATARRPARPCREAPALPAACASSRSASPSRPPRCRTQKSTSLQDTVHFLETGAVSGTIRDNPGWGVWVLWIIRIILDYGLIFNTYCLTLPTTEECEQLLLAPYVVISGFAGSSVRSRIIQYESARIMYYTY